jgi:hypothetical protein
VARVCGVGGPDVPSKRPPGSGRLVPPIGGQAPLIDGRFGHFVEEAGMAPSRCRPFANTEPSPAEVAVLTRAVTLCTRIYRYSTRSRTRAIAIHNGGPARGTRAAIALRAAQPA